MVKPSNINLEVTSENKLRPLDCNGVKVMSMGFVNKGASIMRGPMVNQVAYYNSPVICTLINFKYFL